MDTPLVSSARASSGQAGSATSVSSLSSRMVSPRLSGTPVGRLGAPGAVRGPRSARGARSTPRNRRPRPRKAVPPTTYGVVSTLPVSASWVPAPAGAASGPVSDAAGVPVAVASARRRKPVPDRAGTRSPDSRSRTGRTTGPPGGSLLRWRSATIDVRRTRNIDPLVALANWPCGAMLVNGAGRGKVARPHGPYAPSHEYP